MFPFLKKKRFLKDQLVDFVDIHNHLLPGIDDGAATVDDSIALIRRFGEIGVDKFIATPHIMNDYYPNTPKTINNALSVLKDRLQEEGLGNVKIKAAAEYMMDHSFIEILEGQKLLTLKDNLVLVEMSYFQAPINLNEILFQLQTSSYKPLLAHPERYVFFHSKKLEKYKELKERGCLFQLNLLSITGHYGKNIQDIAFKLIDAHLIDYIGSDLHQQRHLDKLWQAKLEQKKIDQLRLIFKKTKETFSQSFI